MRSRRTWFALAYAVSVAAWLGAAPWALFAAHHCRKLVAAERTALRGGAPGPCTPQAGSCGIDPLGTGCNGNYQTCNGLSGTCMAPNTNCATNMINWMYKTQQCPGPPPPAAGFCANVNNPPGGVPCYDTSTCQCQMQMDGSLKCVPTATNTTNTGACWLLGPGN